MPKEKPLIDRILLQAVRGKPRSQRSFFFFLIFIHSKLSQQVVSGRLQVGKKNNNLNCEFKL